MEHFLEFGLSIVTAGSTGIIGYFFYKLKKSSEKRASQEEQRLQAVLDHEEAIDKALRALCRDRILQGYRYYKRNGGISAQDLETQTKLYYAYHALGGNGTITAIYKKILELPLKESD